MNPIPSRLEQQVIDLCRKGQKLKAVKLYKDARGIGLRESKDAVDQLAEANGIVTPKGTGGCFIATACYGNYDALEVLELRKFRDDKLLKTNIGKMLVSFYYFISPSFAAVIAKSNFLKTVTKKCFLEPIITRLQQLSKDDD